MSGIILGIWATYFVLCAHRLQRVVSLGGLTAQHNAVVAVQHSVGDVAGLSSGRTRFLGHALQHLRWKTSRLFNDSQILNTTRRDPPPHLRGTDDGFADPVALASHHLLSEEDLLRWDFNAQVSTGNHDAVTGLQDLVKSTGQQRQKGLSVCHFSSGSTV